MPDERLNRGFARGALSDLPKPGMKIATICFVLGPAESFDRRHDMKQLDNDDVEPLGQPVRREQRPPEPAQEWKPVPGKPGIEHDQQDRLRTNIPGNESAR